MNAETTNDANPPPRRRFGAGALLAAVVASALASGGGAYLVARRGDDHAAHADGRAEGREQWQCPMHPSIVQDHPGDCPICGMKLVKLERAATGPLQASGAAEQREQWQCPMHPSIVQDHPGDCPICGMKLVKIEGGGAGAQPHAEHAAVEGLATVDIDPVRQQLIGLKTAEAVVGTVGGGWRTVGRVSIDETRVKHINLKVPGYVERIHVDFVGKAVRKGEPLFAVYSPELLSAQEEYLLALRTRQALSDAGGPPTDGDALVKAARRKLQLWDVPASEIARIERSGEPMKSLTFYSPIDGVVTKKDVVQGMKLDAGAMPYEIVDLSEVWVLADVYESELRHVKLGMEATLTLKAYPNRTFRGRVSFIDPLLDPKTRTVKVRLAFPNPTGELKPEMFGEAVLHGEARKGLRIPADAVIDSGTETVVFVALGNGRFQPREVQLGESDGRTVEVTSGLSAGEHVVTRANFLVDSESRLRASLAALSAAGGGAPAAGHAGHAGPGTSPPPREGAGAAPGPNPHAGHGR